MKLRPYQEKCLEVIENQSPGSYLIQLATGLGKTVIFTHYINRIQSNCLIISHREELVFQPLRYITRSKGVEMGKHVSNGEEVISSCIASLIRRYEKFDPNYFDVIIVDEAHHSCAKSYQTILNYFKPKYVLGFTATPNRADNKKLNHVFSNIIFKYNLLEGIKNNYLTNITCKRCYVRYDLKKVKSSGDYNLLDLENEMIESENPKAIGEIYKEHAKGQTLIFGCSVKHCTEIQKHIPDSEVVTAETKNRSQIIDNFSNKEIPCLINCMVFTEGTDLPLIETIIIARPTKNISLYCLDSDTEILTNNGWKNHNDINVINDLSATFNIDTNEIGYKTIKGYINRKLNNNENFSSIKSNFIDIRVSNKHKMIYSTKAIKQWRFKEAEELTKLKDGFYIPVSGYHNYPGIILSDDEIKFIAWVMTDGNINKHNNQIRISQSVKHMSYVNEIEQIIKNCGFKYNKILDTGKTNFSDYREQYIFTISKGTPKGRDIHLKGWKHLYDYFFTNILWNMDLKQFELFLGVCNKADGSKYKPKDWVKRSFDITKGNKNFIENLQIACITRGYKANVKSYINNYGNEQYTIHIKKQQRKHLSSHYDNRPKFINENYNPENCWCIENETGTIITRRNGKVTITGNCQMVGRGLRLSEGKEKLTLIDCVGASDLPLCTAPTLVGIDYKEKEKKEKELIEADLFDLPAIIGKIENTPDNWKINYKLVNLWAKKQGYQLHNVNWFKHSDNSFSISIKDITIKTSPIDHLGNLIFKDKTYEAQDFFDRVYQQLNKKYPKLKYIWDLSVVKSWGYKAPTDKQLDLIKRFLPNYNLGTIRNKLQANQILNKLMNRGGKNG